MNIHPLERRFLRHLAAEPLAECGQGVLVAVSGGADSVALLHLLHHAAGPHGFRLFAAHFDHALRPDSATDADFVAELCASRGIPLRRERCDVASWADARGAGVEEAARHLRYAFLERCADELGCRTIALGHHRQDQAETVLHRMVRGSGLAGLAAMRSRRGCLARPLLSFDQVELRDYLADRRIAYREDPSNADVAYTRNRLRHVALPQLRLLNPRVDEALEQLAEIAAVEEDFWRGHLEVLRNRLGGAGGDLSVRALAALHAAERRRLLLALLQEQGRRQIESRHVLAVERLVLSPRPQGHLDLPGVSVDRRYDRLTLGSSSRETCEAWSLTVEGPGRYVLPSGGEVVVGTATVGTGESRWRVEFPLYGLDYPLQIRPFRPGDRIGLGGARGHKKVKKVFAEARLDREARGCLPLLARGDEILWVPGLRRSGDHLAGKGPGGVLSVELEKPESIESLLVKSGCLC